jgi:hypothetical protein
MGQADRDRYASFASTVDVVTSLKSADKNENWALIWGEERLTDKKERKTHPHCTKPGG